MINRVYFRVDYYREPSGWLPGLTRHDSLDSAAINYENEEEHHDDVRIIRVTEEVL